MRRITLLSLALLALLSTTCRKEQGTPPAASPAPQPDNILLLLKAADNPFFHEIESGARQAIQDSGKPVNLHVRSGETESDVAGQRKALAWFYDEYGSRAGSSEGTAVLITPAASQTELIGDLLPFRENSIPVVLIDTKIDQQALSATGLDYTAYFGSNNLEGGRMAARVVLRLLPKVKHLLLLGGVEGQETAVARRSGFREAIATAAPSVEISERTCNWRRNEARKTVEALLVAGQTVDAIFAANDEMALGAVEAIEASRSEAKPEIVVGFDAIPEALAAVEAHRLSATIAQSPYDMGRMAIEWVLDPEKRVSSMVDNDVPLKVVNEKTTAADHGPTP